MNNRSMQFLNNRLTSVLAEVLPQWEIVEEARQIRWRLQDILADDPTITQLTLVLQFLTLAPRGESTNMNVSEVVVKLFVHGEDVNVIAFTYAPLTEDLRVLFVEDDGNIVRYTVYGSVGKPFDYRPFRSLTYYGGAYSTAHSTEGGAQ